MKTFVSNISRGSSWCETSRSYSMKQVGGVRACVGENVPATCGVRLQMRDAERHVGVVGAALRGSPGRTEPQRIALSQVGDMGRNGTVI